jgi:sodium transport system ATP-binding protein
MIEIRDLWKTFKLSRQQKKEIGSQHAGDYAHAVAGISLTCQPGRIFTLLGPNGAGKTTTLRMIATLMKPSSGTIKVCGHDSIADDVQVRRHIGFLTGSTKLYDRLTPREVVKFYADVHGVDGDTFNTRVEELFTTLDMHEFASKRIGKLSTGMTQKVSIARTMIHDPQVVVFDEPTVGLDVITSRTIIDMIRRCRDQGKTVIFSTHIMGEVSLLSDDLAIIHKGALSYNGTYEDFRAQASGESLEEEFIRYIEEPPA